MLREKPLVFLAFFLIFGVSCKSTSGISRLNSEGGPPVVEPFEIKGHEGTLFAMNEGFQEDVKAEILSFGDAFNKIPVAIEFPKGRRHLRSAGKKFYVIYEKGPVFIIDGATGKLIRKFEWETKKEILDFAILNDEEAFISKEGSTAVDKISLTDGKVIESIQLGEENASMEAHANTLFIHDGKLFAAVSRMEMQFFNRPVPEGGLVYLNVVDIDSSKVIKKIDLAHVDAETKKTSRVAGPIFKPAYEKNSNSLLIPGAAIRNPFDGFGHWVYRLDLKTLTLSPKDVLEAKTFAGAIVISNKYSTGIWLEHTSTPVSSTHFHVKKINPDGTFGSLPSTPGMGTIDIWEIRDGMTLNQDESLAALNSADNMTGDAYRGIRFADMRTGLTKGLPILPESTYGFYASQVIFLQD